MIATVPEPIPNLEVREKFANASPDANQRVILEARIETVEQEVSEENYRKAIRIICRAMINLYLKDNENGNGLGIL